MKVINQIPSRKLEDACRQSGIVDCISHEDGSYWIELSAGWVNPVLECGTIHETSAAECIKQLKSCERAIVARTQAEALAGFAQQQAHRGTSIYVKADHGDYIDGLAQRIARAAQKTGHAAIIPC